MNVKVMTSMTAVVCGRCSAPLHLFRAAATAPGCVQLLQSAPRVQVAAPASHAHPSPCFPSPLSHPLHSQHHRHRCRHHHHRPNTTTTTTCSFMSEAQPSPHPPYRPRPAASYRPGDTEFNTTWPKSARMHSITLYAIAICPCSDMNLLPRRANRRRKRVGSECTS